ncbi:hypothetical protein FS837_010475 [Tulasnella sp. UAMH 9824]|nr:hypothetical protein FS837_010475 [Tulasnella sp. UAMH 9824]
MVDATNYLRDVLPQNIPSNQGSNEEQIAHPANLHRPEFNSNVDVAALLSFVAANGLVHADSIPPGSEREYQQDSILSSYYRPTSQLNTNLISTLGDDESQDSAVSTEGDSTASTESPCPHRNSRNALTGGPIPIPDTGSVSLFLGMRGVYCEDYVFKLIGAPEDDAVDMDAVRAIVGRYAYHYMLAHYFTHGSRYVVAASYSQHCNNRLAFLAALMPRGLAPSVVNYLWNLISYPDEQSDGASAQINGQGPVDTSLAAEDDAVNAVGADE